MNEVIWNSFDRRFGSNQTLPEESKPVLVRKASIEKGIPDSISLGYLKYSAGDKSCPYFVTPGVIGGLTHHWCDCLPDQSVYEFYRNSAEIPDA